MNVDWDHILANASDTPHSLLLRALEEADAITELVIVYHTKDGMQQIISSVSSIAMAIAMIEYAKFTWLRQIEAES